MGMSSRGPALVDITTLNFAQRQRYRAFATLPMALIDDTSTPATTQRLPSQRPIDQRWDRSRGILFSSVPCNVLGDLRWSRGHGIVFANMKGSYRSYASRDQYADMRHPKPSAASGNRVSRAGSLDNAHIVSSSDTMDDGDLLRRLDQQKASRKKAEEKLASEQQAHQDQKSRLNRQIDELRAQLSTQTATNASARSKFEEELSKARQLVKESNASEASNTQRVKEMEARMADHNERIQNERRVVAGREVDVKAREDAATDKECALESIIEENQRNAKRAADEKLESEVTETRRLQKRYYEDVEILNREYSAKMKDWQYHDSRIDKLVEKRHGEKLRLAREAAGRRAQERVDYAAYRQAWDEPRRPARDVTRTLDVMVVALNKKAGAWKRADENFKGIDINVWFPSKYSHFNRRIKEFLQTSYERAMKQLKSLRLLRSDHLESQKQFENAGHYSRELTRYHKFGDKSDTYSTVTLINKFCNVDPFELERNKLDEQIKQLRESSKEGSNSHDIDELSAKRALVQKLVRLVQAKGDMEAAKAMLSASAVEQERFHLVTKPRRTAREANNEWEKLVREQPNTSSEATKDRTEYKELHHANIRELDAVEVDIHKRQLLEMHLGIERDDSEWRVKSKKQLRDGEITFNTLLEELVLSRDSLRQSSGGRVRGPLPTPTPPIKRIRVTSASPQKPPSERIARLQAKLKSKSAYLDESSRQGAEKELDDLMTVYKRDQLARLRDSRARLQQSRSPEDLRKLAHVEGNIRSLEAQLAPRITKSRSTPSPGNAIRDEEVASGKSQAVKAAPPSKNKLRRDRKREANKKAVETKKETKPNPAGLVRFKPTGPKLASHAYAASRCFHVNAVLSVPEPDLSSTLSTGNAHDSPNSPVVLNPTPRQNTATNTSHQSTSLEHMMASTTLDPAAANSQDQSVSSQASSDDSYHPSQASQVSSGSDGSDLLHAGDHTLLQESASSTQSDESFVTATEDQQAEEMDGTSQLTYQISAKDYRSAVLASKSTNAAYWSHKLYQNAEGRKPTVYYCTNYEQTEARAKEFVNEPVIGFDIEWEMGAQPGKGSIKRNVSLIQIASEDKIGLFQVALFKGDTADKLMPPTLRSVLESKAITKTGVNIQGDARRLEQCLNVTMTGLFELSHLYRVVMFSETALNNVNRKPFKLADQVQNVLLLPLKKDDVRVSAWSKKLNVEQTDYAASDAYAGFHLYHALESKRKKMDPMPPRPAFYEEHKPLQLGDGTLIKPYTAKRKIEVTDDAGKVVEDEEDESEEFFDAVESLDSVQLDSSQSLTRSAGVPLAGITVTYPTLPSLHGDEMNGETTDTTGTTATNSSSNKPPSKRNGPPPSPEVEQADRWIVEWKAGLPNEYICKVNAQHLRAYHLWHHQNLTCPQVAALLREAPLQLQTVASYVLEVLKQEDLAFSAERVKEPIGIIPVSVRGRYQKVVNKME